MELLLNISFLEYDAAGPKSLDPFERRSNAPRNGGIRLFNATASFKISLVSNVIEYCEVGTDIVCLLHEERVREH